MDLRRGNHLKTVVWKASGDFWAVRNWGSCMHSRLKLTGWLHRMHASIIARFCCLVMIAFVCTPRSAMALSGNEFSNAAQDIVLSVDSRWVGNSQGGYVPIRVRVSNLGPTRDITLVFDATNSGRESRIPTVKRKLHIEQNASLNLTLPIPIVTSRNQGDLKVFDQYGSEIEGLRSNHSLPKFNGIYSRSSLLVISSLSIDLKSLVPFDNAAVTESAYAAGFIGTGGVAHLHAGMHHGFRIEEKDALVIPPFNLPSSWVDYSGIEFIAVDWQDFQHKLKTAEREAIVKWTACGGTLIVYSTEKPAAETPELNKLLGYDGVPLSRWSACQPSTFLEDVVIVSADELLAGMGHAHASAAAKAPTETNADIQSPWSISDKTFSSRDLNLGKVYVFPSSPFPGTNDDWAWFFSTIPAHRSRWSERTGINARQGNSEFLNFLIPGVGDVPIYAFLVLMTIFTIVIGPLNYYWLKQRRRLAALVFTVPIIAAITSLTLFTYSLVSDGFSIRNRVHSFTLLDQKRQSAISLSRICLYAPFAPSAGLVFPANCAINPIWSNQRSFENGTIDWSQNDQRLTGGWFRSQTWTQFMTQSNRDERGRLDFTKPASYNSKTLTISNGLAWQLKYVAVHLPPNQWYVGTKIPAGAKAELTLTDQLQVQSHFAEVLLRSPWVFPVGLSVDSYPVTGTSMFGPVHRHMGHMSGNQANYSISNGHLRRLQQSLTQLDNHWQIDAKDWRNAGHVTTRKPHSEFEQPYYLGELDESPGIETGVKNSIDQSCLHLIRGEF